MSNREVIERAFRQWRYESLREGRFPDCYRPHDVVEAVLMAWHLAKDPRRYQRWRAYWQRQKKLRYARHLPERAPPGGVWIGGKYYEGGQFIPQEVRKAVAEGRLKAKLPPREPPQPSHQTLKDLIDDVLSHKRPPKGQKKLWVDLGEIRKEHARLIERSTGVDLRGYRHIIDDSAIRHIWNRHGEGNESDPQLEPLTQEDILLIPKVFENPDKIIEAGKTATGRLQAIQFVKRINGWIIYVTEVRTGKKQLAATTMWKKKAKG